MAELEIRIDTASLEQLALRYGSEAAARALHTTRIYTQKLEQEARKMLKEKHKVNTGALIQNIQPNVAEYGGTVQGQVNSSVPYSRFIHEGAKHDEEQIVPHFVPFAIAPSLRLWAIRNKVIYKKKDKWYFKSKKTGKEYTIDIVEGGLKVKQEPIPYFEAPFEKLSPEYFEQIKEILE